MSTRAGGAMGDVLRAMRPETRDVSARADWAERRTRRRYPS